MFLEALDFVGHPETCRENSGFAARAAPMTMIAIVLTLYWNALLALINRK